MDYRKKLDQFNNTKRIDFDLFKVPLEVSIEVVTNDWENKKEVEL